MNQNERESHIRDPYERYWKAILYNQVLGMEPELSKSKEQGYIHAIEILCDQVKDLKVVIIELKKSIKTDKQKST